MNPNPFRMSSPSGSVDRGNTHPGHLRAAVGVIGALQIINPWLASTARRANGLAPILPSPADADFCAPPLRSKPEYRCDYHSAASRSKNSEDARGDLDAAT